MVLLSWKYIVLFLYLTYKTHDIYKGKVQFTLQQAIKAPTGSIALLFL